MTLMEPVHWLMLTNDILSVSIGFSQSLLPRFSCSEADNGASLDINMTTVSLFGEGEESGVERRTEIRAHVNCSFLICKKTTKA